MSQSVVIARRAAAVLALAVLAFGSQDARRDGAGAPTPAPSHPAPVTTTPDASPHPPPRGA